MKKIVIIFCLIAHIFSYGLTEIMREKGFVYLHEIDPTIQVSLRYYGDENFVGEQVRGYNKSVVIITKTAAQALQKVQAEVKKDGYCLVVYDAYRPQSSVNHFIQWSKDFQNQTKKSYYYPYVDKEKVFDLGYVAKRSGHTRGSTVDLTLIKDDNLVREIKEEIRYLADGRQFIYLNDGTIDMGASFDLFDEASHTESNLVTSEYQKRRQYLKNIMEKHGFKNYACEWWHFSLIGEPFSADKDESYFDFPIE